MMNQEQQIILKLFEELTYVKNVKRTFNTLRKTFWTDPLPPDTISNNGFFGQIQGPFNENQNLMTIIKNQCNQEDQNTTIHLTKIGIHNSYYKNIDLSNSINQQPIISINEIPFVLGQTGILELEDVDITSLIILKDVDNLFFINYQYVK